MIKEINKKKKVPVYRPETYEEKNYTVYECSDGKRFSTEKDYWTGRKPAKQLADEYEERLKLIAIAKKELRFYSIVNDKHDNEGFECEFCFYWHINLSDETKNILHQLVYELNRKTEMVEGWYLVKQRVYEIESSSRCSQYGCDGYFGLLATFISWKENEVKKYKHVQEKSASSC